MSAAARGGGGERGKARGRGKTRGSGAGTGLRGRAIATGAGVVSSDEESRNRNTARSLKTALQQNVAAAPRGKRGTAGTARRATSKTLINNRGRSRAVAGTATPTTNSSNGNSSTGGEGTFGQTASVPQRYQALKKVRDRERAEAIANGFLADPDKPRTLADAITPVGTCQSMCPEFERVERIVQNDVWTPETVVVSQENAASGPRLLSRVPDENLMVKKFRRAAAGIDEQLPSDLRPPVVLKKTLDYLLNDVIGNAESLSQVHHFVWDRTRAIRNDFSIQQITKIPELRIAIECYERIARFHILSLHLLASPQNPYDKYDAQQEKEQLDKTLLSLMQYYDDSRGHLESPNEAEFRAYCIIFQIRDPIPNLEDRVQTWPKRIVESERVNRALKVYAAACSIMDSQGPLKPRARHPIAQTNWRRFWNLVTSNEISYLMACVAETYFNLIRRTTLNSIWQACRQGNRKTEDWTLGELVDAFGMDDEQQVQTFCEAFGFVVDEKDDGTAFLDLSSVQGTALPDAGPGSQIQISSELVEEKRHARTIPAVISGMSIRAATEAGLIELDQQSAEDMDHDMSGPENDSLFVTGDSDEENSTKTRPNGVNLISSPFSTPVGAGFTPNSSGSALAESSAGSENQPKSESVPTTSGFQFFATNTTSFNPLQPPKPSPSAKSEEQVTRNPFPSNSSLSPSHGSTYSPLNPSSLQAPNANNFTNPFSGASNPFSTAEDAHDKRSPNDNATVEASAATNPFSTSPLSTLSSYFRPSGPNDNVSTTQSSHSQSQIKANEPLQGPSTHTNPNQNNTLFQNKDTKPHTSFFSPSSTIPSGSTSSNLGLKQKQSLYQPSRPSPLSQPPQRAEPETNVQNESTYPKLPQFNATSAILPSSASSVSFTTPQSQLSPFSTSGSPKAQLESQSADSQKKVNLAKKKADRESRYSETLDCVARALVVESNGFLDQFLDYTITDIIHKTQVQIQEEKHRKEADSFRYSKLQIKYAKRWRQICWSRHLQRSGRERRRRLARHREFRSSFSPSRNISAQPNDFRWSASRSPGLLPDALTGPHSSLLIDPNTNNTMTASRQIIKPDMPPPPLPSLVAKTHRRAESLPDNRKDAWPTRPSPLTSRNSNLRNSLLSGNNRNSLTYTSRYSPDSTKSTYFKLKAKGLDPLDPIFTTDTSGRKRSRSSVDSNYSSIPEKRPITSSSALNHTDLQASQPSFKPNHMQVDEDDELLARVRRAREAMTESVDFFKDEIAKDEEHRLSQSLRSSPAPSITSSMSRSRDAPPKYRSRPSKFLPKDRYAEVTWQRTASDGTGSTSGIVLSSASTSQQQAQTQTRQGLTGRPLTNGVIGPRTVSQPELGMPSVVTTQLTSREARPLPKGKPSLSSNPFEALANVENDSDDGPAGEAEDNDYEENNGEEVDAYVTTHRRKPRQGEVDEDYIYSEDSESEDEEGDPADDSGEDENGASAPPIAATSAGKWGGKMGTSVEDAIEL